MDGQNFCVTYTPQKGELGPFGSRTRTVDKNDIQFGDAVNLFFKIDKNYPEILSKLVNENSGKNCVFNGVDEITFFFEYYGENSFAGKHQEGDEMHLALIDVFLKKKGYIEPKDYENLFRNTKIEMPDLIYIGSLNSDIVEKIQNNDWTQPDAVLPNVKEGVVFKRSTLLKGQRRPSVKVKTKWWLEKLHSLYTEEECKKLE